MLKRSVYRKLTLCGLVLCSLMLLYALPINKQDIKIEEEINYVNTSVNTHTIYLLDQNNYISQTKIVITEQEPLNIAKELIDVLISGGIGEDKIPNGFKSYINSNTKVNTITMDNDIINIDFSKDLLDTNLELEEKTIQGIVYTLTSIDNINKINISIDGEPLKQLPQSKISLPNPIDRQIGVNKEYQITNPNNVTETTIYYINSFNDQIYYTPITLVTNDTREKIEIIVDELSNNYSKLDSYLPNNTELLDSHIDNNVLYMNFNDSIFNSLEEEDILEEVIYTIGLSVGNNYDVEDVSFQVNGQEINKTNIKALD